MRLVSTLVLVCSFILPMLAHAREQTVRSVALMNRSAVAVGRQVAEELGDDVKLHTEGQRIILTGAPKRVAQIEKLIRLLDTKETQWSVTLLQSTAPIVLDAHSSLLQLKVYETHKRADRHQVQRILVTDGDEARFSSATTEIRQNDPLANDDSSANHSVRVYYRVKPHVIAGGRVQLELIRHFEGETILNRSDKIEQDVVTTLVVPVGHWVLVSGESAEMDNDKEVRHFVTKNDLSARSHVYVKVEKVL